MRQLQKIQQVKQEKRFESTGIKKIPISRLTDRDLDTLDRWYKSSKAGASANKGRKQDTLLLEAIEKADDRFSTQAKFERAVRHIAQEVERGAKTGTYTTIERKTFYDPRVGIEILKLSRALGKGWSFCVHLLMLYGLKSFADSLASEGFSPPTIVTSLPKPGEIVAEAADLANEILERK